MCNEDGIKTLSFVTLESPYYYYDPLSSSSLGSDPLKGINYFKYILAVKGEEYYVSIAPMRSVRPVYDNSDTWEYQWT